MEDIISRLIRLSFPFLLGFGLICLLIDHASREKSATIADLGHIAVVLGIGAGCACVEHGIRKRLAKKGAVKAVK